MLGQCSTGALEPGERLLARSSVGVGTLLLAAWLFAGGTFIGWALVADRVRLEPGEGWWLRPLIAVFVLLIYWAVAGLLCSQVVVTSRAFLVRTRLGWRRVAWGEVEAIEASRAFGGRLILGIRYRSTSGGRRWLAASHYAVQGGYHEVLCALVSVASSNEHRGQVRIAPLVVAEASRGGGDSVDLGASDGTDRYNG